jgi:pyridoxamine 5'-phosphate oxidase family protein
MVFTEYEIEYLRSQRWGRLASLIPGATLQNCPVGFWPDEEASTHEIGGEQRRGDR